MPQINAISLFIDILNLEFENCTVSDSENAINITIKFKYFLIKGKNVSKLEVTDSLIDKCIICYDKHEKDDPEYKKILDKFEKEISQMGTPTEATFNDMIEWLLPSFFSFHVKEGLKSCGYSIYKTVMEEAFNAPTDQKLSILVNDPNIKGIGIVTGTAVLHFRYPDEFPIMNRTVAETLYRLKLLKKTTMSVENYALFRKAILI